MISRRAWLAGTVSIAAGAGLVGWWGAGSSGSFATPSSPFAATERQSLAAAVERIFPGAVELGVPEYIDTWLKVRPFSGAVARGFKRGASHLERLARETHQAAFAALSGEQQDKILEQFERGELKVPNFTGRGFFQYLVQFTLEGLFSDPKYGGNRDGKGFELIGRHACHWAPSSISSRSEAGLPY